MALKRLKMISHRAIAGCMAVWLTGVVFLLCCQIQQAEAAEIEFCPLKKLAAHCDKADKNADSLVISNQTSEQGMDCCAFLPIVFDKTRTIETSQQAAVDAPAEPVVELPKPLCFRLYFSPASSYRSTILLRNNTFLKNRTFRI